MKVAEYSNPAPVKSTDFDARVDQAIEILTHHHFYDAAIKLAKAWEKPVDDVVMSYALVCIYLQHGILPKTGDSFDYIRHVDTSGKYHNYSSCFIESSTYYYKLKY